MEIVLTVTVADDGRLTGTARADAASPVPFSGNLELLAVIERICDNDDDDNAADCDGDHDDAEGAPA